MAKIIAIADDLTGAADCAAPCAAHGVMTSVVLHGGSHPDLGFHWPQADLISIDANTRGASAEQAERTTATLTELCCARSREAILFKKVDSTLRGNMAAELAAMLRAYRETRGNGARAMILAPALPSQGRTTLNGRQMVQGRVLEEMDLWNSGTSLPRSNISEVLAKGGLSSRVLDLAAVRADTLTQALANLARAVDVLICDAETDEDLRRIGRAAVQGEFALWAGSAGLAAQLPHSLGLQKKEDMRRHDFSAGPTLTVVGSAASISREQAHKLAATSAVISVRVSCDVPRDIEKKSTEVIAALRSGHDTLVFMDGDAATHQSQFAQVIDDLVKPCVDMLGGFIATGGETARALLDALGIDRLQLLGEIEPGLPFAVAEGWTRPLPVVTKAGAFGSPDALARSLEFLRKLERAPEVEA